MYESTPVEPESLTDTPGIHHVTGIVRDAQSNVDFYTGVVGLRLLKHTVNSNNKFTRHLFYGDETGAPGTVLTLFSYPAEGGGRIGKPQISAAALVIPPCAIEYWADRLAVHNIDVQEPVERFEETVIKFRDPEGTSLELVTGDPRIEAWHNGPVDPRCAIRGINGVTILSTNSYATAGVLETLGFDIEAQEGDRVLYRAPGDRATVVDVLDRDAEFGREGVGSFHHVAVPVPNEAQLFGWHKLFLNRGYDVSRVTDRHFFHSLYVREPGGILFELATEGPGVTTVGPRGDPGQSLYLPPWLEVDREIIERQLPALKISLPEGPNEVPAGRE